MASKNRGLASPQEPRLPGYTIELRLQAQKVVLVGGGSVARRKLPELLAAGASVCVIDPANLPRLPEHPQLTRHQRSYKAEDLNGARLVFAATSDPQINEQIAADAAARQILCCRADSATASDFSSPARLNLAPLTFSVSTNGENPAMAAVLRDQMARMIPHCWQTATQLASIIRQKVLTEEPQIPYNQRVLLQLVEQGLLEQIACCDLLAIDQLLLKHFGVGFSLQDLQFSLPEGTP